MKVISTDGAILNLSRYEAIRIVDQSGNRETIEAVDDFARRRIRYNFRIVALSGLGRSGEPTETIVAEASAVGIVAVWEILSGIDRPGPFILRNVIARAEADALARDRHGIDELEPGSLSGPHDGEVTGRSA